MFRTFMNWKYDIMIHLGPLPRCQAPAKVGDGVCDRGNNHLGCQYDGGDCCLPAAKPSHCIDPCGVRLKFYGGTNSELH